MADDTYPATGHPGQDTAKYGLERRGDDGNAAAEAQRLSNAEPAFPELAGGRCPVDGLPAGNCAHFPGPQAVIAPDGGVVYEEGHAAEEKAAREDGRKEPRRR